MSAPTTAERLDALRNEHCYITSTDSCCHCGDCECDGIGCIANFDPDDSRDHEAIEDLHHLLRQGQAWCVMHAILEAGEQPLAALMLAEEALAEANNRTITADCDECMASFQAQGPRDTICTTCRVEAALSSPTDGGLPTAPSVPDATATASSGEASGGVTGSEPTAQGSPVTPESKGDAG